ncbi:ROK family protein [Paenibacillus sp. NPDC056722]|uniref:ROK family protein n=1 Tax=Paenibacillus sp. NPDC056722 TaxID=3345924 RepID=UPI0036C2A238
MHVSNTYPLNNYTNYQFIDDDTSSFIVCIFIKNRSNKVSFTYAVTDLTKQHTHTYHLELWQINLDTIVDIIKVLQEAYISLKGIGIGLCGSVHEGIIKNCEFQSLIHVPLESILQEKFNTKVLVENEMNLIAYGVYLEQNDLGDATIVVVSFDKNKYPRSGLVENGSPHVASKEVFSESYFLPSGFSNNRIHERSTAVIQASDAVISMVPKLQPKKVVVTGDLLCKADVKDIIMNCSNNIPQLMIPEVIFRENLDQSYKIGLMERTMELIEL